MILSIIDVKSRVAILSRELRSTGAAYWADASQINTDSPHTSITRFATKDHRICVFRGYTGWYTKVGAHQKYVRLLTVIFRG